jgi:protein SCO1/2
MTTNRMNLRGMFPTLLLAVATAAAEPARSLAEIPGTWQTDKGQSGKLADLPGSVRVMAMFYGGCHMACPITVEGMQWIQGKLSPRAAGTAVFVLATLDPGGDTPAELATFRVEQRLNQRWTLLRGTRAATRELADLLGVSFADGATRLTHTAVIAVIDGNGRVVSRHRTLRPDLREIVAEVERLAAP